MNILNLLNILKLSYRDYDDYRFGCFISWCSFYTELGLPLQALATSKPLYKWYCAQWQGMVERAFFHDCKDYIQANVNASSRYIELLAMYPKAIEANYPSVIFDMIKNELKPQSSNAKLY